MVNCSTSFCDKSSDTMLGLKLFPIMLCFEQTSRLGEISADLCPTVRNHNIETTCVYYERFQEEKQWLNNTIIHRSDKRIMYSLVHPCSLFITESVLEVLDGDKTAIGS